MMEGIPVARTLRKATNIIRGQSRGVLATISEGLMHFLRDLDDWGITLEEAGV